MTPQPRNREPIWGEQFAGIIDAARAGSDWAWADIYDGLAPVVLGYLRGRGGPDPEDLLGETFLHAVRNVRTFEGDERAFRAWLLSIAHRRLVDHFRYRGRRPVLPATQEELTTLAGATGDVADEIVERSAVHEVLVALKELSPDQQDVLVLRLVGDLSLEEVADILGKRITAVKALQRRGLAALQKKISLREVSP